MLPIIGFDFDDEKLVAWKKGSLPRGPPRFGKRAAPANGLSDLGVRKG